MAKYVQQTTTEVSEKKLPELSNIGKKINDDYD